MVDHGLAESREKAQALIMAGEVLVDGQKAAEARPDGRRTTRASKCSAQTALMSAAAASNWKAR